jgi:hypothetical protein
MTTKNKIVKQGDQEIIDFDPNNWAKTQYQKFDSAIHNIRYELREVGNNDATIYFNEEALNQITKKPKQLIKQLLDNKFIYKTALANHNEYAINNTNVYCRVCYRKEFDNVKTGNNYKNQFNYNNCRFREYEIINHLEAQHYFNYRGYDGKQPVSEQNKLTPEKIKEYISYSEPNFEIKEHDFEVIEMDNSRFDRVYMKIKCKNCGYDRLIVEDVSTCTKEKSN